MFIVPHSADRVGNRLPSALVVEGSPQRCGNERAAPATAHTLVEFLNELVFDAYVQTHGHSLAH
jgi:hypothetical protein